MKELFKGLTNLLEQIDQAFLKLDISSKQNEIKRLSSQLSDSGIWNNPSLAELKSKRLANSTKLVEPWEILRVQTSDMIELVNIGDNSLKIEFEEQFKALQDSFYDLQKTLMFKGKYDGYGAIIRLSAGVGGTDAQDWAEMLERMYLRWAEKTGLQTVVIERSAGEEAGIKSSVIEVNGPYVYGKLQSENGVHRLVRLSPFNSDNLRQTSFALVEVLPQIDEPDEVEIDDKDLKIDVYRSGGKGGQSVNTTDSAVRVTHLPTNIVVAIQNERSQLQNKETALRILRSKLVQLQLSQHADSIAQLRAGESANWGSQIRNYVLHPYTMVKDTRTKYEERNINDVLDGKIDGFIESYLKNYLAK